MFESYNRLKGSGNGDGNLPASRFDHEAFTSPKRAQDTQTVGIEPAPVLPTLEQAAEFFQVRAQFLAKIRVHLEKMRDLAHSNAEAKVNDENSQQFYHHACTIRQIASTTYNGAPLFAKGGIVAEGREKGNQLVMEGLDLSHHSIAAATAACITSKTAARASEELLGRALHYLTVVESVLDANLSRLAVLGKHIQLAG